VEESIEEKDLRKLERANPIIDVALALGIKIQGNMGKCFRTERHSSDEAMSLFFNPAKNSFFCKICQDVGGSVIDLVCQHQGWDRQKAMVWLAERGESDYLTRKLFHRKSGEEGADRAEIRKLAQKLYRSKGEKT